MSDVRIVPAENGCWMIPTTRAGKEWLEIELGDMPGDGAWHVDGWYKDHILTLMSVEGIRYSHGTKGELRDDRAED